MNKTTLTGFFTLGVPPDRYHLPHPRLGLAVILLIRRVLCRAFEILREEDFNLAQANEDQVTAALRAVIENNLRPTGEIPGFNHRTYESVVRQGGVANFDNSKVNKSPDLCFKLRPDDYETRMVLSEFDALFVECKPVDKAHTIGKEYCNRGLIRFVIGDYAWAMQEGMMLAYARDGKTIAGHLIPAMSNKKRMTSLDTIQLPQPCTAPDPTAGARAEIIHVSKHRRNFDWPDNKGTATEITIYHLWHDCG